MSKIIVIESDDEERNGGSQMADVQTDDDNKNDDANTTASDERDKTTATTRRRPRKCILMTKPNPDVHFETVALDDHTSLSEASDDDSNVTANEAGQPLSKQNAKMKKSAKFTTGSIAELTSTAYAEFLDYTEVKDIISTIGEERARINFMLVSAGMPKIDFQLYTPPDSIQVQFEDRFKQINDQN